jgi:hypothetical protein
MSSAARIAANRRNAEKSTGPRSVAGKARSRRNAFRHGLAIPVTRDVCSAELVGPLAEQLLAQSATPAEQECALLAAEVQAEILRARHAKVDLLERAARDCLCWGDARVPGEIAALAFLLLRETLPVVESYESRALAKRRRMLRAMIAAERANVARERAVKVFIEPIERLDVATVVTAALAQVKEAYSGEVVYRTGIDLGSAGTGWVEIVLGRGEAACGSMRVQMNYAEDEISTYTFSLVKRAAGVARARWLALCPRTGRPVASLHARRGEREINSRFALDLHYRSQRARPKGARASAPVDYAAVVAEITKPFTGATRTPPPEQVCETRERSQPEHDHLRIRSAPTKGSLQCPNHTR